MREAGQLLDSLDCLVFDCDGVVYVGTEGVPGTARLAAQARARGIALAFMTNDTTKSRRGLADAIRRTGVEAADGEVVSAGWATALWCAEEGLSPVAHLGTAALADGLRAVGVEVKTCMGAEPGSVTDVAAIVLGSADDLSVRDLDTALVAWRSGIPVVAGNGDATYPGVAGPRIGCGSLAEALTNATGQKPVIVGKPEPIMFREAERVLRGPATTAATTATAETTETAGRIALLGDSIASDVVGANRAGWTSILLRPGTPEPYRSTRPDGIDEPDLVIGSPTDLL